MITIRRYQKQDKKIWNAFVVEAKNGLFLFNRGYMEYHKDRFTDCSLLFSENGVLRAVLPANISGSILTSHAGLTFGGIISGSSMTTKRMLDAVDALVTYAKAHKVKSIVYKAIPSVYHRLPASEDLYALFRHGARLTGRDIASVVDQVNPVPFNSNTKRELKQRHDLVVRETRDYAAFMQIVASLLHDKYKTKPVHTADEITLLARSFPDTMRLFGAYQGDVLVAGVLIYDYPTVAHCQYIAASPTGKSTGALAHVFYTLITDIFAKKRYFSFGKSTERMGEYLNEGLIMNKEHYGGRAIVHDTYTLTI